MGIHSSIVPWNDARFLCLYVTCISTPVLLWLSIVHLLMCPSSVWWHSFEYFLVLWDPWTAFLPNRSPFYYDAINMNKVSGKIFQRHKIRTRFTYRKMTKPTYNHEKHPSCTSKHLLNTAKKIEGGTSRKCEKKLWKMKIWECIFLTLS